MRNWSRGTDAIAAALTFAVAVGLFTGGGWWLDRQLGTLPVFLIVGALLGLAGGFLHVVRKLAPDLLPFGAATTPGSADPDRSDGADRRDADG